MKSEDLPDMSHILPQPSKAPWNSDSLSWTTTSPYSGIMEFNAQQATNPCPFTDLNRHKRKSEPISPLPAKQLITDDKMAAHLDSLHISSDFIQHTINNPYLVEVSTSATSTSTSTDVMDDTDLDCCIYPMTAKDLEEKLKRANRITVCNEVNKLKENDIIIPKELLLNHQYQKPCTALIVWQPPQILSDYIQTTNQPSKNSGGNNNNNATHDNSDDSETEEFLMDNNNSSNVGDLNNCSMDTDL